jgi:hypothetical protein
VGHISAGQDGFYEYERTAPAVCVGLSLSRWHDEVVLGQGWQSQWTRVLRRLDGVRTAYTGAPGGTDEAIDAVLSFLKQFTTSRTGSGTIQ